ncbi:MAG: hypothetical protein DRO88_08760 [Promethearchaeia archaeon]|nr:MAG: hypothetical protein DRO88_08760 [Candidatus Lokiarchaeia archaeon]
MEHPTPTAHKSRNSLAQIRADYHLSLLLFKENIVPLLTVGIIGSGLFYVVDFLIESFIFPLISWDQFSQINQIIIYNLLKFPAQGILFGFFGAIMGMVRDILGSGDGFTQIQNFVGYIALYWGKFFILSILVNIFNYLVRYTGQEVLNFPLAIIARICSLIWFILLVEASPALVYSKNIISAIKDNFQVFRHQTLRVIWSFLLFYVIFILPMVILFFLEYHILPAESAGHEFIRALEILFQLFYILIGYPINGFIATRIYYDEKFA